MKKILISVLAFTFLTFGTALASTKSSITNPNVVNSNIGVIDVNKIMRDSPKVKEMQRQLNEKGNELRDTLDAEKHNLSPKELDKRNLELYKIYMQLKLSAEKQLDESIELAVGKVAKEKKLAIILYKGGIEFGGIDVTMDVMNSMMDSYETQTVNQIRQPCNMGFIDKNKIMQESPKVKAFQDEINQKGKALSDQLEMEKANLTPEKFSQKREEAYGEFMRLKKEKEGEIEAALHQAVEKVSKKKKLVAILYKNAVAYGGLDVTLDVMNRMEEAE